MDMKLLHFYPDLMSLYGSYANLSVLKRLLGALGHTVAVEAVVPGGEADLSGADFLFMGAGTERQQKAALADFRRFGEAVKAAAAARAGGPATSSACGARISMTTQTRSTETMAASAAAPDKARALPPLLAVRAKATVTAVEEINAPASPLTTSPRAGPSSRTAM